MINTNRTGHVYMTSLIYMAAFLLSSCSPGGSSAGELTVISDITIIDPIDGQQDHMDVIIEGNRIKSISNHQPGKVRGKTIDGQGKFILPGLWDFHVHLSFEPELTPPDMFKLFMANGVTSIRDTGGQLDLIAHWRDSANVHTTTMPRVKIAGPLLDGIPTVYDGSSPQRPKLGLGAATEKEAIDLVNSFADAGVDLIKAYEMLTPEIFAAVVRAANEKGLQVTGHVPLSMDVISASNAGMRSIEHMRNLEMSCSSESNDMLVQRRQLMEAGKNDPGGALRSRIHSAQRTRAIETQDPNRTNEVISALAQNNTWQIPTLTIVGAWENRIFARDRWINTYLYLPETVRNRWAENSTKAASAPINPNNVAFANWGYDMVNNLNKGGVGILAGTDCPIFFLTPGFSLHEELRLLVNAGLTPQEAIAAATIRPAEYFNMQSDLGRVSENMIADLLILNKNPLDDINNTVSISAVIKDGALHDREALDNLLAEVGEK